MISWQRLTWVGEDPMPAFGDKDPVNVEVVVDVTAGANFGMRVPPGVIGHWYVCRRERTDGFAEAASGPSSPAGGVSDAGGEAR
jgi:hypothetical protein